MNQLVLTCISTLFFVSTPRLCHGFSSSSTSSSSDVFWGRLNPLSRSQNKLWDPKLLSSKMTVRLVKKSWQPKGLTSDQYTDEFPGDVNEAYSILRANTAHDYTERPMSAAGELFTDAEFDRNLDSIIIFHPLFSSADDPIWSIPTITALAMRNVHRKFNIFLYNFPKLHKNQAYTILREVFGFKPRYEEMAEAISPFILEGVRKNYWKPNNLHLIGFSWSGNLLGYVARYVKYATKMKINTILSLDPFTAQYNENLVQVSKRDAEVVHVLHTSSYVQGSRERVGTADFVFNDGFLQPECKKAGNIFMRILSFLKPKSPFICSHGRVIQRFWYLILYPSKFQARQCETWPMFRQCECEGEKQTFLSYPIANRDAQGIYYLRTGTTKPYGLGDEGSHCSARAQERFKQFKEKIENAYKMQELKA